MHLFTVLVFSLGVIAFPTLFEKRNAASINVDTVALIEKEEEFKPNFYDDGAGHKIIGYGHNCDAVQDCVSIKAPIIEAQAFAILQKDILTPKSCVCKLPNADMLNAYQSGAMVSLAFDTGCKKILLWFDGYMTAKNYTGICDLITHTATGGKKGTWVKGWKGEGAFCSKVTTEMSVCNSYKRSATSRSTTSRSTTSHRTKSSTTVSTDSTTSHITTSSTTKPTRSTTSHTTESSTTRPSHSSTSHSTKSNTKTHTMGALENKVLRTDEIDRYIMHLLAA